MGSRTVTVHNTLAELVMLCWGHVEEAEVLESLLSDLAILFGALLEKDPTQLADEVVEIAEQLADEHTVH